MSLSCTTLQAIPAFSPKKIPSGAGEKLQRSRRVCEKASLSVISELHRDEDELQAEQQSDNCNHDVLLLKLSCAYCNDCVCD